MTPEFEFGLLIGLSLTIGWLIRAIVKADGDALLWLYNGIKIKNVFTHKRERTFR